MTDQIDGAQEPAQDEKAAQADGRVAEQETVDAADESGENKPGDTIGSDGGAVSLAEDSSGGEVRGQPSEGAVLDEKAFGGSNEVPPVTETDGDVDANAEKMNAGAESDKDEDKDEDTGDDMDYEEGSIALETAALAWHQAREANSGNEPSLSVLQRAEDDLAAAIVGDGRLYESGRIALDTTATLLGKFQALAKGEISREEARQWLEENFPE